MSYPHPLLAKEGWPFIAAAFMVAVFTSFLMPTFVAVLCWLALAFIVQFFRDPPRAVPSEDNAVLCPADGRVVRVARVRDPYADRERID